ncbi:TlpA family protein disulfide reductase [Sedimenticola hydrogenitrophicus]|uniref:TlpA family protein disulfide reductase n=1 Tax=Sedimenticola hydrogenitrophicus TaxID=2967975 RepID=UPI0021A95D8A|nr:TlpA disulfide reductase family protein [Sedimenticola hydrogenitrophicus]
MKTPAEPRRACTPSTRKATPWPGFYGLGLLLLLLIQGVAPQTGHASSDPLRFFQLTPIAPVTPAPPLVLSALDGVTHRLSDYQGQVVVINFWSSWCTPCRREMPSLEQAWQRLRPFGVTVLGVAMQDDPEVVGRFLRKSGVTFTILMDPDGKASQRWPFSGIPATFVLDRQGRIVYRAMGLREWDSDEIIDRLIELAETE